MGHSHSSNSPQRDLIPYLYTGKYQTSLTGLIDMDDRWYNPQVGRFIQPDYYNFAQLALPNGARNKLLATTSLNSQMLLNDPSQQMRYGYVSGNPMCWVDPMGLVEIEGAGFNPTRSQLKANVAYTQQQISLGSASVSEVTHTQQTLLNLGYDLGARNPVDGNWGGLSNSAATSFIYEDNIITAEDANNIPRGVLFGLIQQESAGDPNATSYMGAVGLTQIMPNTGRELGIVIDNSNGTVSDNRNNPVASINAGANYLSTMYGRMEDEGTTDEESWRLAVASYNAGAGNTNSAIKAEYGSGAHNTGSVIYNEIKNLYPMPEQTTTYVNKILGLTGDINGYANTYATMYVSNSKINEYVCQ